MKIYFFTSESVTEGHPDKVADLISDNVANYLINQNENDVKTSLQNKENELKETSVLISTNETLVETTSEKINSLKDKLIDGSISTNKEYDAMMETIDFEKNLLSEKENELIELMSKRRVIKRN